MTYTVSIALGAYAYTITKGDVPDPDAVMVLDGLRIGWRFTSEELAAPLEPMTANLLLGTFVAGELDDLVEGDVATLELRDGDGYKFASLYGHVSELTATQVRRRRADGSWGVQTLFAVALADASVNADRPVSFTNSGIANSVDQIEADLAPVKVRRFVDLVPAAADVKPQQISNVGGVTLMRAYAMQNFAPKRLPYNAGSTSLSPAWQLIVVPIVVPGAAEPSLISLHALDYEVPPVQLPATLGVVDGKLTLAPVDRPNSIPASQVRLEAGSWRRGVETRFDAVTIRDSNDRTVVVYRAGMTAEQQRRAVRREVKLEDIATSTDVDAQYVAALTDIGRMFLGPDPMPGWDRDSFTWDVPDPAKLKDGYFPDWSTTGPGNPYSGGAWKLGSLDFTEVGASREGYPAEIASPCFVQPVAVHGIPDAHNMAGKSGVYAGRLRSVDLQLLGGKLTLTFSLRRQLYPVDRARFAGAGDPLNASFTYGDVPATTYGATDADLTYADVELLVRKA